QVDTAVRCGRYDAGGLAAATSSQPGSHRSSDRAADRGFARCPPGLGSAQDCTSPEARPSRAGDIDGARDPAPVRSRDGAGGYAWTAVHSLREGSTQSALADGLQGTQPARERRVLSPADDAGRSLAILVVPGRL